MTSHEQQSNNNLQAAHAMKFLEFPDKGFLIEDRTYSSHERTFQQQNLIPEMVMETTGRMLSFSSREKVTACVEDTQPHHPKTPKPQIFYIIKI